MPELIPKDLQLAAAAAILSQGRRPARPEYVAYYRVSTDRQGASGLGLDAQRESVGRLIREKQGELAAEFVEIESGRRHTNRPQLAAALQEAKKRRGVLMIAKLDRLARNVHFVSGLMESGVEFIAADMPHANKMVVHIMAAFAEYEREANSQRTREALAAAKARGTKLGNPRWPESVHKARASRHPTPAAPQLVEMMRRHRDDGESLRQIAARLNNLGLMTPAGNAWYASTVRTHLERTK